MRYDEPMIRLAFALLATAGCVSKAKEAINGPEPQGGPECSSVGAAQSAQRESFEIFHPVAASA